ncbi:MAG: DUF4139 domain-containing protein [Elusimicrobiota bacterium]|nr:DUF4139 domain-containing protein [Elusimicrobiota bacterium]
MKNKLYFLFIIFCSVVFSQQLKEVELTIYNQNLALVKEKREVELKKGTQVLKIQDVAGRIDPTSVHFKSITAPDECFILEQSFDYDLISQHKLLEKYIGKEIEIKEYLQEKDATKEITKKGILISIHDGRVVKIGDKIHLNPQGVIVLPDLPEGLITKPTLSWLLSNKKDGRHIVEISYLTEGINWTADYVLVVDKYDKMLDLTGWVTIDNQSGTTYKEAKLKLIAGDIHRVELQAGIRRDVVFKAAVAEVEEPQFKQKEFFEYHIYTLQRKTTIKDNEKKQIEFVKATDVAAKKLYIYDGAKFSWWGLASTSDDLYGDRCNKKVWVILEFKNSKENNLGLPLPKGKMRVYKKDEEDMLQFIGEDQIDHTPKDETIRIYLGNAFDIVGERKLLDRKSTSNTQELKIEIKIKNRKKENIEVVVIERHYAANWKILDSTHKWTKRDVNTIEFILPVAKENEETIVYSVKYWW